MRSSDATQGRTFLGGGPTSDRYGWSDGGGADVTATGDEGAAIAVPGEGLATGVGPYGAAPHAAAAIAARKTARLRIATNL